MDFIKDMTKDIEVTCDDFFDICSASDYCMAAYSNANIYFRKDNLQLIGVHILKSNSYFINADYSKLYLKPVEVA